MLDNLKPHFWLALLIIATTVSPGRAWADACSNAELQRAAAEVVNSRKTLLALPLGEIGKNAGILPPSGAEAIDGMKNSLNSFVVAYMSCLSPLKEANAISIQRDLSSLAHAYRQRRGWTKESEKPKDYGKYGFELWFEVRANRDERSLISITATFDIECASDTMLLIFSPGHTNWQEVLRWQSPPYKEVRGAFSIFQYGISPTDETGRWYVVTLYINGWCASTWSTINYAVLRIGSDLSNPHLLFAKSESIWWGNEDYGHLIVNKSNFELRFHGPSIDAGVLVRVFIRRYSVAGDDVRRIAPVAMSPKDFVDEWIVSRWSEAKGWSAGSNSAALASMHERLSKLNSDPKTDFAYQSVKRCVASSDTFQVELCPKKGGSFYFRIQTHPSLTIMSVEQSSDPDCRGGNLLDSMATR